MLGSRPSCASAKVCTAKPNWRNLFDSFILTAAARTFWTAGKSSPMRTANIAITTSSSISENAARFFMNTPRLIDRELKALARSQPAYHLRWRFAHHHLEEVAAELVTEHRSRGSRSSGRLRSESSCLSEAVRVVGQAFANRIARHAVGLLELTVTSATTRIQHFIRWQGFVVCVGFVV